MNRNALILLYLIAAAMIPAGCSDDLPTQGGVDQPDGPRIWYSSYSNNIPSVNSIDPDKKDMRTIVSPGVLASPPRLGKIAFWVKELNNVHRIFTGNVDGSNVQQIDVTTNLGDAASPPVLSPNGGRIAYSTHDNNLYAVFFNGDRKITLSTNAAYETIPVFSPDGRTIAFYGDDDRLYIVPAAGGTATAIADSARDCGDGFSGLSWSPGGDRIAFTGTGLKGSSTVSVVGADGSGRMKLANVISPVDGSTCPMPAWSPDGQKIAFIGGDGSLWVMNSDGSNQRNLSQNFPSGSTRNAYPQWSADSKKLLYTTLVNDETGFLYYIDFDPVTPDEYVRHHVASNAYKGFWVD